MAYFDLEKSMKLSAVAITLNRVHEYVRNMEIQQSVPQEEERKLVSKALEFLVSVQKGMGDIGSPGTIEPEAVYNTNLLIEAMEHRGLRLSQEQIRELDLLVGNLKGYFRFPGQFSAKGITHLMEQIGELAAVMSSYSRLYAQSNISTTV